MDYDVKIEKVEAKLTAPKKALFKEWCVRRGLKMSEVISLLIDRMVTQDSQLSPDLKRDTMSEMDVTTQYANKFFSLGKIFHR